jgi:hypothetical protein
MDICTWLSHFGVSFEESSTLAGLFVGGGVASALSFFIYTRTDGYDKKKIIRLILMFLSGTILMLFFRINVMRNY